MAGESASAKKGPKFARHLVALACVCALSAAFLFPERGPLPAVAFLSGLLALSMLLGLVQQVHLSLICLLLALKKLVLPGLEAWPFDILLPLLGYSAIVSAVPRLRRSVRWLVAGGFGKDVRIFAAITVIVSSAALVLWYLLLTPDIGIHTANLPRTEIWALCLSGMGFALSNAAMEEAVFRGTVMESLESAFGPGWVSIALQAALFGIAHYEKGFPNGWLGVGMAFAYGLMMGYIRRRSGGMLAVWVVHVFADLTVFGVVVYVVYIG